MAKQTALAKKVQQNTKALVAKSADPLEVVIRRIEAKIPELDRLDCDGNRLARIFITQIRTDPDLLEAAALNPLSAITCLMKLGEWRLDPSIPNEAFVIRYNITNSDGKKVPTLVPQQGYQGLMKLARRGGKDLGVLYDVLDAREVCEGDIFTVQYGAEPKLEHEINPFVARGETIGYYAVAVPKGGKPIPEFLTVAEARAHKKRFCKARKGPLADEANFDRYGCKTVMRLLCTRRLDLSPASSKAILEDIAGEKGEVKAIDITPSAVALPEPAKESDVLPVVDSAKKSKPKKESKKKTEPSVSAFDEIKGYTFTSGPAQGETIEDVAAGFGVSALETIANNPQAYSDIDREFAVRAAQALG